MTEVCGKGGGGSTEIETGIMWHPLPCTIHVARVVVAQLRLKHPLRICLIKSKKRGKGGGGSTEIETLLEHVQNVVHRCGKGGGGSTEIETCIEDECTEDCPVWQGRWWLN